MFILLALLMRVVRLVRFHPVGANQCMPTHCALVAASLTMHDQLIPRFRYPDATQAVRQFETCANPASNSRRPPRQECAGIVAADDTSTAAAGRHIVANPTILALPLCYTVLASQQLVRGTVLVSVAVASPSRLAVRHNCLCSASYCCFCSGTGLILGAMVLFVFLFLFISHLG